MFKKIRSFVAILFLFIFFQSNLFAQGSIVDKYGQLSIKGNYIMSQYGDTVQLRGMSLFWSQWMGQFYNADVVKWFKDDWKCTVIRAAMGVDENGGYMENPYDEKQKVMKVVDAAIANGIYVIIDYHSHNAHSNPELAKKFFAEMAKKYGKYPNVLYEVYNEPLKDISWMIHIKPYEEAVIKSIREFDPDNIVICGTRQWSQLVYEASRSPITDKNVAYTLHFYAASHGEYLWEEAKKALENGICIFVTEFGTCEYTGDGKLDYMQTQKWFEFMDQHKISWCNWSVSDKAETASALQLGARAKGKWQESELTPSGLFVKEEMVLKNTPLLQEKKK